MSIIVSLKKVPVIQFHWVRGIIEDHGYPIEDIEEYSYDGEEFVHVRIATPDSELGMDLIRAINTSHETRKGLQELYDKE